MSNLVQELNSLDFSVYIGGPLQAAVDAQHAASMSQVNFIQQVGFEPPVGTVKSFPCSPCLDCDIQSNEKIRLQALLISVPPPSKRKKQFARL